MSFCSLCSEPISPQHTPFLYCGRGTHALCHSCTRLEASCPICPNDSQFKRGNGQESRLSDEETSSQQKDCNSNCLRCWNKVTLGQFVTQNSASVMRTHDCDDLEDDDSMTINSWREKSDLGLLNKSWEHILMDRNSDPWWTSGKTKESGITHTKFYTSTQLSLLLDKYCDEEGSYERTLGDQYYDLNNRK